MAEIVKNLPITGSGSDTTAPAFVQTEPDNTTVKTAVAAPILSAASNPVNTRVESPEQQQLINDINNKNKDLQILREKLGIIDGKVKALNDKLEKEKDKKKDLSTRLKKQNKFKDRLENIYKPIALVIMTYGLLLCPFMAFFTPLLIVTAISLFSACAIQKHADEIDSKAIKTAKAMYDCDTKLNDFSEDIRQYQREKNNLNEKLTISEKELERMKFYRAQNTQVEQAPVTVAPTKKSEVVQRVILPEKEHDAEQVQVKLPSPKKN